MSTGPHSPSRQHVLLRIAAAMLGGYAFCWGFVALSMAGLFALGMSFHDAEHLCAMLAFLLYVTVFCWAFATRSLARAWAVLAGGAALMAGAASLLQMTLV
ncbi:MAG: iron uptake protein [Acidovorax sp.]|nr:iron uptake protein [Acidovorax sp.]